MAVIRRKIKRSKRRLGGTRGSSVGGLVVRDRRTQAHPSTLSPCCHLAPAGPDAEPATCSSVPLALRQGPGAATPWPPCGGRPQPYGGFLVCWPAAAGAAGFEMSASDQLCFLLLKKEKKPTMLSFPSSHCSGGAGPPRASQLLQAF